MPSAIAMLALRGLQRRGRLTIGLGSLDDTVRYVDAVRRPSAVHWQEGKAGKAETASVARLADRWELSIHVLRFDHIPHLLDLTESRHPHTVAMADESKDSSLPSVVIVHSASKSTATVHLHGATLTSWTIGAGVCCSVVVDVLRVSLYCGLCRQ